VYVFRKGYLFKQDNLWVLHGLIINLSLCSACAICFVVSNIYCLSGV